jgi:DNA-binding response OmpR family regulator
VARVLICEPHDDISALLEAVVRRLGHQALSWTGGDVDVTAFDAALVEPGEPAGMRLAIRLHAHSIPVLFTSIFPPDKATLALEPAAYLVKPFPLYRLEEALIAVLLEQPPRDAVVAS